MNWLKDLRGKVKINEPLSRHTTFRIGGKAKYFIEPGDAKDLKLLLERRKKYKVPLWVIGAGSNLLVGDNGLDGIVVKLSSSGFRKIRFHDGFLEVGAGVLLSTLTKTVCNLNLSGCEFLVGIPGTVGGALTMNAGTKDKEIGVLVEDVTLMDYNANTLVMDKKRIRFGYRWSNLSKYIILKARLRLVKENKKDIQSRMEAYLDYRRSAQDLFFSSAGCIFKNPKGLSAGWLIDSCGFKGKHFGDAQVSCKHANFIINKGRASAQDVWGLINCIRGKVKDKFNIDLEPEIKIWY
jgi:UDP-N-acetylmuramate dehydrogenase